MLNYEGVYGRLPPAVVYGKDGKALYSWRVPMLPYLEENGVYEKFHLDEPWDSPNNLPLAEQMPLIYAPSPRRAKLAPPNHTFCHVFIGKGSAFEDPEGQKLATFTDDRSKTLLIMEAGPAVPWTKPEGLLYVPDGPLPEFTPIFRDRYRTAMVDGANRHIPLTTSAETFRALITRNGGESLPAGRIKEDAPRYFVKKQNWQARELSWVDLGVARCAPAPNASLSFVARRPNQRDSPAAPNGACSRVLPPFVADARARSSCPASE
jgi:Protein of unknown function (DUF1559)